VLKDHDGHIWLITRDTTHEGHLVWTWVDSGGIGRSYCSYKPTHGAVEDMTKFRELYEQGKYTILNAKLVIE
jgi:hypothetical protein